jgi:dephospho-CoA kinase
MIIGICGKSGCGKTTLAQNIINVINKECVRIDIDKVGHQVLLLDEVKEDLINTFGIDIITDNYVDRKKLNKKVFSSKEEMDKLTDITWKWMQLIIDEFLLENKDKVIILDWLLLPKSKYFNMCDIKILLDIPYEIRKERALKRDNITSEAFDLREQASYNYNNEDFDIILKNNDLETIKRLVKKI